MRAVGAALVLALLAGGNARARASSWEALAHPNAARCQELLESAAKLAASTGGASAAVQTAKAAARLCASDVSVLVSAGELMLVAHDATAGRACLEHARALATIEPLPREIERRLAFHLGFAREVTGDVAGALVEHRRLEALGGLPPPNEYLVYYDLADELMAVGRLDDAIAAYERATRLAPGKAIVHLALAVALDRDEQVDHARAELATVLALDPELHVLSSGNYVFVPAADAYYYRAIAVLERGDAAQARLALRTFVAEEPSGPYLARARKRLAELDVRVDPREIEVRSGSVDTRALARVLGPSVAELEDCLPPGRIARIPLQVAKGAVQVDPRHPAAECLNAVLDRHDTSHSDHLGQGVVAIPLAGRRAAAALP